MVGKFTEKEGKDDEEERSQGRLSLYIFECTKSILSISGDDYMEEIPVPIPNTEVKLQCAEDICGLPCWENRLSPGLYSSLAQLVERSAVNR